MAEVKLKVRRPDIGWGAFLIRVALYLAITVLAGAIILFGYQFPDLEIADNKIPAFAYLVPIALFGFLIQRSMSRAYGVKHVIDKLVSLPMLIIVIAAVLVWADVAFAINAVSEVGTWVGYPPQLAYTEYAATATAIFGFFALIDFGRDYFAKRYPHAYPTFARGTGSPVGTVAAGHIDQPPHAAIPLESESGNPFFVTKGKGRIEMDEWEIALPSGRVITIEPTERLEDRLEWNLARRALPRPDGDGGGGGH